MAEIANPLEGLSSRLLEAEEEAHFKARSSEPAWLRRQSDLTAERQARCSTLARERVRAVKYAKLDDGVRATVWRLRRWGLQTTDSGDGRSKRGADPEVEALSEPHVFIRCYRSRLLEMADWLQRVLADVPGVHIEASYDPKNQVAILAVMGLHDGNLPT